MRAVARSARAIGPAGTTARLVVGSALVAVLLTGPVRPAAWLLGLLGLPALTLAAHPRPLRAIGPVPSVVNIGVFFALFLTPWYAPVLAVSSNAAQLFYGAAMLLAAARGYAGCEVLAVSNWLLRRDDQIGCLLFEPIDRLERARRPADRQRPEE